MLLGFDASRSLAWLAPLDDEGNRHGTDLCQRHADTMVVPKGWWLDDQRLASPQLFTPPTPIAHSSGSEPTPVSKRSPAPPHEEQEPDPLPLESAVEWAPRFDKTDDLDGLLDAGTPLLGRAFSGRPRSPDRPA